MDQDTRALMCGVNTAIIKIRGAYAAWAKAHGVNYHKTLILYSMRDNEECTQKQISENYRLPKQTVNNIVTELRREGMITLVPAKDGGREKVLCLTEQGEIYAAGIMEPLLRFEEEAARRMGIRGITQMTELAMEFGQILEDAIADTLEEQMEQETERQSACGQQEEMTGTWGSGKEREDEER